MNRIRLVGARRDAHGRCAICHGAQDGSFTFCPRCGTPAHEECVHELARDRCPTLGCAGRPPVTRAARPRVPAPSRAALDGRGDRPRPSLSARAGPYLRLVVRWLACVAVLVAVVAAVVAIAREPAAAWELACRTRHGARSILGGIFLTGCSSIVLLGAGLIAGILAVALPLDFLEVRRLLDRSDPIPMRVGYAMKRHGATEERVLALEGRDGVALSVRMGAVAPDWLATLVPGSVVWVYGYPPPGPYAIELPDGRLAIVD